MLPQINDGENLMTVIKRYLDPRFDALDKALQGMLQRASNDNRQFAQKVLPLFQNECRSRFLINDCRRLYV